MSGPLFHNYGPLWDAGYNAGRADAREDVLREAADIVRRFQVAMFRDTELAATVRNYCADSLHWEIGEEAPDYLTEYDVIDARDEALAAIQRVRDLHRLVEGDPPDHQRCTNGCGWWPCETYRALTENTTPSK